MYNLSSCLRLFPFKFWTCFFAIFSSSIVEIFFPMNPMTNSLQRNLSNHHQKGLKQQGLVWAIKRVALNGGLCYPSVRFACSTLALVCFQGIILLWWGFHVYLFDRGGWGGFLRCWLDFTLLSLVVVWYTTKMSGHNEC